MTNFNSFKRGQLIFFPSNGAPWDRIIQMVSPKFTHVGIITGKETMIDTNFFRGVKEDVFKVYSGCEVYSIKSATEEDIDSIVAKAKSFEGQTYDMYGAIIAGILRTLRMAKFAPDKDDMMHCSELVTEALRAKRSLYPNVASESIMPDDLPRWSGLRFEFRVS
jgi:hypothetical protein